MQSHWTEPLRRYCERTDASFWSEPYNAATNAVFLLVAYYAFYEWFKASRKDVFLLILSIEIVAIGLGSFVFHTVATRWSVFADTIPIALFTYTAFAFIARRVFALSPIYAVVSTITFAILHLGFAKLWIFAIGPRFILNQSIGYFPALFALAATGILIIARPTTARQLESGLVIRSGRLLIAAAVVFALGLIFRSLDRAACAMLPIGTHFAWHILIAGAVFLFIRTVQTVTEQSLPDFEKPRA
jgi:hypothetical protein